MTIEIIVACILWAAIIGGCAAFAIKTQREPK